MSAERFARDKRLLAAEYVVPFSIDLCFHSYESPNDVLREHVVNKPSTASVTEMEKSFDLRVPMCTLPAKPAFIIALATGSWPSTDTAKCSAESTAQGNFSDESSAAAPVVEVASQRKCQQQSIDHRGVPFGMKVPMRQNQQQHHLSVHNESAGLLSPSGARLSVCVSRHSSIISVCAPPKSALAGTVLEPFRRRQVHIKFIPACVRFSHNQLKTLENLVPSLHRIMLNPEDNLQWLDLGHNQLTSVDPVLKELGNLRVLYLHGNLIADFTQLHNLRLLEKLKILTLIGNPVEGENCKKYRQRVLALLPQVRVLDHTAVSNDDCEAAAAYERCQSKRKLYCRKHEPKE